MNDQVQTVVENLFRQESGKLAASLARTFGLSRLTMVEDIVQDSLVAALETWSFHGVPENPTAWLHRVAKNKAIDLIRHRSFEQPDSEILPGLAAASHTMEIERNFLAAEINDSMLRMMFACAHPGISIESQIALVLKTLCGFSVQEIASAFLTQEGTIEKRLGRARKYFRDHHVPLEAPVGSELSARREAVMTSLYLLFNEGYKRSDSTSEELIDRDLCLEALRLALLLTEHELTRSPETYALVALMTLHAARFDSRMAEDGAIVLLPEQDRSKWNQELIDHGMDYFVRSEPDRYTSSYHIEAAIQSLHVTAPSYEATDWAAILGLYRRLYELKPSSIVAMHQAVAIEKVHGAEAAVEFLIASPLPDYYLYHAILGDALVKTGREREAQESFQLAIGLARNAREKEYLQQKLDTLIGG